MSRDILFRQPNFVFSYRVAGVLIHHGRVLMQRLMGEEGYAFVGGHVNAGETAAQALVREFQEEVHASILPEKLLATAEVFIPWGDKPCHQLCLYYRIRLAEEGTLPLTGSFHGWDELGGKRFNLEYVWLPVDEIKNFLVYPPQVVEWITNENKEPGHFVYTELPPDAFKEV